ncbi:cupin domain-containing protein [Streptomyces sp. NPDC093085]|uniref:cupin domain-containing protein n=1 Tax=Streptomyces sp. NPDC093085 TaxID=3155068 RepID=UPI003421193C
MPSLIHLPRPQVLDRLAPAGQRAGADAGDPQLSTLPVRAAAGAQIGIWECTPGGWPVVDRPDTETCYIISGRATLTDDASGRTVEISAGDFLVLPPGWSGRWDVTETLRKAYSIF